jgi:hypothetical protein
LRLANSLDLDPEWGGIDLIEEVEATFGIEISNQMPERCSTVGDLYSILCELAPQWEYQDGSCGSSMVFYRFRRAMNCGEFQKVTPTTALSDFGITPSRFFKRLADDTGLRLPAYDLTWLGNTGGLLITGGSISSVVALLTGHWIVSVAIAPVVVAGILLLRIDPGRLPDDITSIGDLVKRTVPLNTAILKEAGGRPGTRWSVLVALAAEYGTLPTEEIGPETFFHRKSLQMAAAR